MRSDAEEAEAASPHGMRRAGGAWLALVLGVIPLLGAWFPRSPEPPQSWDQATHLLLASDYHDAWARDAFPAWRRVRDVSTFYPPFYHVCVAALFPLTGPSSRAAGAVGGVMLIVLALATGALARRLHGLPAGVTASSFVLASPSFAALAGQPLVDLTLAALVAATVWLSTTPRFLGTPSRALGAGLLAACGLLTKWVFPVFVAGPLLVRLAKRPRPPLRGWVVAAVTAALLSGAWYVPHAGELLAQARVSAEAGRAEGDPSGLETDALTYYLYAVVMFFPLPLRVLLLAAAGTGAIRWVRRRRAAMTSDGWLLASWLAVPLVVFTSIANKDPRYVAAAAPALAVLGALALGAVRDERSRGVILTGIVAYAVAMQAVRWRASDPPSAVGHALAAAPRLAALVSLDEQAFVVPAPAGWPVADVIETVRGGLTPVSPWASLAVVPDLPHVNPATLRWAARRAGYDLRTFHPTRTPSPSEYSLWEYALVKPEGAQGTPHATTQSAAITTDVLARPAMLLRWREFESPQGPLLLVRTRHGLPPADLRPRDGRIDLEAASAFWHLGDGWSFREEWGRWAIGDRAVLRVELPRGVAHRVTLSLAPPEPLVGAQVVTVRYGGRRLRSFRLDQPAWAWDEQPLELPAGVATGGIDVLSLSFTHTVPAGPDDPRALAAAVRFVRFEPD